MDYDNALEIAQNPEEYAKSAFEDRVKQALGDLNLDDVLNSGFNRILINGKPLEFPKNASNAFVEQSLYNQLAEAVVAGRKITYFVPNAETGVLEANEMKVSFNKYVKAQFRANGPKTSISTDPKMKADDLAAAEAAYLDESADVNLIAVVPLSLFARLFGRVR